jgi:hypothetical protein
MSIFGNIMSGISAMAAPKCSRHQLEASLPARHRQVQVLRLRPPPSQVDVEAVLSKLASQNKEKRKSIVDLMKLLNLDISLSARKELAKELHYTADTENSAAMNIWLHKQVMIKLAENGGKISDALKA